MLGIKDLDKHLMMGLDDRSLFNLCQVNTKYHQLCQDDNFWKRRSESRLFPLYIKLNYLNKEIKKETWKDFYLESIYIPWKDLIWKTFKSVSHNEKISVKAIAYLTDVFEKVYEKLNEIPIFPKEKFREELRKLIGDDLEKHAWSEMMKDKGYFKNTYDKRKILEYLLAEVLELAIIWKNSKGGKDQSLRPKHIDHYLQHNDEFKFLKA